MPPACAGRGRILIVEDDPQIGALLTRALGDEGYPVTTATDAALALELMRSGACRPCLVLLDVLTPAMDGWQVLEMMDVHPRVVTIPTALVATGGTGSTGGYRKKPVDVDGLLRGVREICALCAGAPVEARE